MLCFFYVLLSGLFGSFSGLGPSTYTIDVSHLPEGKILQFEQGRHVVWILHRSDKMLSQLASVNPLLASQPEQLVAQEYFVFLPHFNWQSSNQNWQNIMRIKHLPESSQTYRYAGQVSHWPGGFVDQSNQQLFFDYAGRVYQYRDLSSFKSVSNLPVPEYEWLADKKLKVILE
jgi:hypothetical protein